MLQQINKAIHITETTDHLCNLELPTKDMMLVRFDMFYTHIQILPPRHLPWLQYTFCFFQEFQVVSTHQRQGKNSNIHKIGWQRELLCDMMSYLNWILLVESLFYLCNIASNDFVVFRDHVETHHLLSSKSMCNFGVSTTQIGNDRSFREFLELADDDVNRVLWP